jgi:uncharacterized membrane protein
MSKQILYLGDTALKEAASYLAGIMDHFSITFEYLPSDARFPAGLLEEDHRAIIISDYPAKNFSKDAIRQLANKVEQGTGLLMIGGWESFTGLGGDYGATAAGDALPVELMPEDDRVNCAQPCLVEKMRDHPIVAQLPFQDFVPGIGGYNRVCTRPGALEILSSRRFAVRHGADGFLFEPAQSADPLLVVGSFGKGRTAAFTSDAAPHWVGGLVDWGDSRVNACGEGANPVEVGNWYARLFGQMIRWVAQL